MSIVYVGDCAYKETADAALTVDPWNMDSLTRYIEGRVDQMPQYLSTLKRRRDIQDSEYKGLYLVNYSITAGRAFAKAELHFGGVFTDDIPEPVFESENRAQQVTLPLTLTGLVASANSSTFTYIAPSLRVRYALREKAHGARYRGYVECNQDSFQIQSQTGAAGGLSIFKGPTLNTEVANQLSSRLTATPNAYNAVAQSFCTSFRCVQVGQWWQVEELNEVQLQPLTLIYTEGVTYSFDKS